MGGGVLSATSDEQPKWGRFPHLAILSVDHFEKDENAQAEPLSLK
jgi:hypothetical protein